MTTRQQLEKLRQYQADYKNSRQWREKFEDKWRLMIEVYSHRDPLYCGSNLKRDRIQVNYVHSTVNTIMDSTLHRHPKITVTARSANVFRNSVIAEHVLNQQWQTKGWQRPHRLAFLDKLLIGHGWTKITYQFTQEEWELSREQFEAAFEESKEAMLASFRAGERAYPKDEEIRESIERKGVYTLKDQAQVERVSPFDIFVDVAGKDMDTIGWIAQRITVKRRDFEADERFPEKFRDSRRTRTGNESVSGADAGMTMQEDTVIEAALNGVSIDFVHYVEFYDIREGTVCWFLEEGGDDFLIEPAPMPYAFGQPFEMQRGTEVPDRFYPIGEVEIILDQQRELNELRTDMLNDRKKGARQYLYKPDNVGPEFEEAMKSDADELLIPIPNDVEFGDVMAELPYQARIRPELYDQTSLILQDIFQLTGITDYQRGGGASARTATQVAVENDASLARQGRQLKALEEAMAATARKALQLMQQFMSESQVLRLSNVGQQFDANGLQGFEQRYHTVWFEYGPEDIGGEFDVAIEAGSTRPMNDSTRAQSALQLMNAVIPFLQLQSIDPAQLLVYVLRELGVPNPEAWVREGVDPRGLGEQNEPNLSIPSVAGGVGPVGANVLPEQQPGQGSGPGLDAVRAQLAGQTGLAQ